MTHQPPQLRFTKKPVTIEAFQMTRERRMDNSEWPEWLNAAWNKNEGEPGALFRQNMDATLPDLLCIQTLEGAHLVQFGDWIIQGVKGELYPCKPDIFEATYSPATQAALSSQAPAVDDELPGMWSHADLAGGETDALQSRQPTAPVAPVAAVPEGWRLVPAEPTDQMLEDGMEADCCGRPSIDDDSHVKSIWSAMLAASPTTPPVQPDVRRVVKSFEWVGELQHHVPMLLIEFDPVPANAGIDAKGWKDRDAMAAALTAAQAEGGK